MISTTFTLILGTTFVAGAGLESYSKGRFCASVKDILRELGGLSLGVTAFVVKKLAREVLLVPVTSWYVLSNVYRARAIFECAENVFEFKGRKWENLTNALPLVRVSTFAYKISSIVTAKITGTYVPKDFASSPNHFDLVAEALPVIQVFSSSWNAYEGSAQMASMVRYAELSYSSFRAGDDKRWSEIARNVLFLAAAVFQVMKVYGYYTSPTAIFYLTSAGRVGVLASSYWEARSHFAPKVDQFIDGKLRQIQFRLGQLLLS